MDITPKDSTTQPISDDQELAKALAGVLPDEPEAAPAIPALQFEETPAVAVPAAPAADATLPTISLATPEPAAPVAAPAPVVDENLESIKSTALNELRPLMGKVDLPAEEKFDTYLMLIRSTDDASLIGPAHVAAQGIADEKKKAEALLEIIKEIDYLSRKSSEPKA